MGDELKYVSAKSLECPLCMDIFKDPKILSCSHTYCKACLKRLLECHEDNTSIRCPVCRVVNQLPNRDVSQLQTNLALQSLLEDATKKDQSCTDCRGKGKDKQAKVHCQNCGKYFCLDCLKIHGSSGLNDHEVLPMHEVATEKTPSRQRRRCRQHQEEDQCFCRTCQKYVCVKCGVTEHAYKGHQLMDATVYEQSQKKADEELKSMADLMQENLHKYVNIIDEQKGETSKIREQCIVNINQAYDESVQQLGERKEILIQDVTRRIQKLETELHTLKDKAQQQSNLITTMTDLLASKNQGLLEMEALTAHNTLREDLQNVLGENQNLNYDYPLKLGKKGKQIVFHKNLKTNHCDFGGIYENNSEVFLDNGMNAMTATPDGMMAVGCCNGGIKIFSADGLLQETVLDEVKVLGLAFLSDGRCVVRNTIGVVSLFSSEYEKLDVLFESANDDGNLNGKYGGLAVTANDNIYVGNMTTMTINVFLPTGGNAIRDISCLGYGPHQITSHNDDLLITYFGAVTRIDTHGVLKRQMSLGQALEGDVEGWSAVAALSLQSEAVLIAWAKHDAGRVSIVEYTKELEYLHAFLLGYRFEKSERNWYSLGEFTSGDIAFCTAERLYIFKRGITCSYL